MKFQSILKWISYRCKMQGLNYETGKGYKIIKYYQWKGVSYNWVTIQKHADCVRASGYQLSKGVVFLASRGRFLDCKVGQIHHSHNVFAPFWSAKVSVSEQQHLIELSLWMSLNKNCLRNCL